MKSILLILMLTTILLSSEKQIIVGSYLEEKNALNALVRLESHTRTDTKLSKLINLNSIEVELKKMGDYHAISLFPFTNYVQLLRTLKSLKSYYPDAYVLDNGEKINMAEVISKVKAQEVLEEVKAPVEKEVQKQTKAVKVESLINKKKTPDLYRIKDDSIKQKQQEEEKDDKMEIILALAALLFLLALGIFIFKIFKKKKEDIEILE